ncbi:MAG TPA: GNAT family protein [Ktedonobacteraceae bacterium]|nr:GNAT family protein [Ktedonobacteraceae bacterium]
MTQDTSNMQNPFITGERIYLRPLEPAQDNHHYSTWMNDEEIRRYFSIYPTSDTRGKERLEQLYKDGKHIIFGVALNEDNRLIGLVGLKDINYINQSAEFYVIIGDRSAWGKGYGTEATKLMTRYGFMELNLNRIQTQDMEENIGGWRADEKAGFTYEGTLREVILRFGKYNNVRVYSLLKSEYLQSNSSKQ